MGLVRFKLRILLTPVKIRNTHLNIYLLSKKPVTNYLA